jgi:hypothetical protein
MSNPTWPNRYTRRVLELITEMSLKFSKFHQKIHASPSLIGRPSSYSEANTPARTPMDLHSQTRRKCHQKHYSKDCYPRAVQPTTLSQHVLAIIHETRETYITAEVDVEDNIIVREERVDVAGASSIERHQRRAPSGGIRCIGGDIRGNASPLEEPNLDTGAFPQCGVDAPTVDVEVVAVGVLVGCRDAAAV